MITTRNFRDILHMARHKRPHNFSLHFEVPWQNRPLVKRRNRIPVTERILPPDGRIDTPLDEDEVFEAIKVFKRRGIKSVVIGFLFSFLNDAHERQAKAIVEREMADAFVCCSSEVANVIREFERFSTAAMNAFIGPKTSFYLNNLQVKLAQNGFGANLRIIQSNGGITTVETSSRKAVNLLASGPAGARPSTCSRLVRREASSEVAPRGCCAAATTSLLWTSAAPRPISAQSRTAASRS